MMTLETLHRAKNIVRLGAKKITYRGCQIWNISPDNIKHVSSLENLKRRFKNWKGEKHSCRIVKHTRRIWDLPKQKRLWAAQKTVVFCEFIQISGVYSESNLVSEMEIFLKLLSSRFLLRSSVSDVRMRSEHAFLSFYYRLLSLLYGGGVNIN